MNMDNHKDLDLIEKYFDKELSKEELVIFDHKRQSNTDFIKALEFRKALEAFLLFTDKAEALNKTIDKVEQELMLEEKHKGRSLYKVFAVAASILFLLGCAWFFYGSIQENEKIDIVEETPEPVESEHIGDDDPVLKIDEVFNPDVKKEEAKEIADVNSEEPDHPKNKKTIDNNTTVVPHSEQASSEPNIETTEPEIQNQAQKVIVQNPDNKIDATQSKPEIPAIADELMELYAVVDPYITEGFPFEHSNYKGGTDKNDLLHASIGKYTEKDYRGALVDFEALLQINPEDHVILLYKGMCYLSEQAKNYPGAIVLFEKLVANESAETDELNWRLALLYIRTGALDQAKLKLEGIIALEEPAHEKKKEAIKLLKHLN